MGDGHRFRVRQTERGRLAAAAVRAEYELRLVESEKILYAIGKMPCDHARIIGKPITEIGIHITAPLVKGARQIPMQQRNIGHDAVFQEFVHDPIVKIQPLFVYGARAFGKNTIPGKTHAKSADAESLHHRDILPIAMIKIAGGFSRIAVTDGAGALAEHIPHGLRTPVATQFYGHSLKKGINRRK